MTRHEHELEAEALHRVKPRYEREGFRFLISPDQGELPEFLAGYQPDAIAKRGEEGVVIEVKGTGRDAERSAIVNFLAREVPKHEGWRFDLVIADQVFEDSSSLEPLSEAELEAELEQVVRLVEEGNYKIALPYAWGLLEAAAKNTAFERPQDWTRRFLPRSVVEKLISEGLVDDETGENLFEIGRLRNQIVHGFARSKIESEQLKTLIDTIRRLIHIRAEDKARYSA